MHIAQMAVDNSQRGFVRPLPGQHTKARQTKALRDAGVTRHYVIGEVGVESWRDVVRHMRDGYVLAIEGLALLPDPKSKDNPAPPTSVSFSMPRSRTACVLVISFAPDTGAKVLIPWAISVISFEDAWTRIGKCSP